MKNPNLDLKTIGPSLKKRLQPVLNHGPFIAILAILLVYVLVVVGIGSLTSAEPSPEAESAALAGTAIPKVDKETVKQIEALEQSSTELKAIFDAARNNPFLEQ